MKTFSNYFIPGLCVIALLFGMCKGSSSDKEAKTGKAGDQLDLFAVMSTFEKSSSPESFEKSLNSKSGGVNNLDLNEDGQTDYIKVTDKKIDDQSHVLILQVDVAAGETQDVATIQLQKKGENEAYIQIVGDEDLYGSDYIVEPQGEEAAAGFVVATTYAVNVWTWPAVAYIYSPAYVVWASPYYYEYYPVWWEPWPVVAYDVYYPVVSVYHVNYAFSDGYRFVNVHENYHNNYRVKTHFNYHEKNYGSHDVKVNVKNDNKGDNRDWKGNDGNQKDNSGNKSSGNDKNASPANDQSKASPGNDKNKSGGNDYNKSQGNDKSGGGQKQDAKKSSPADGGGINKTNAPKSSPQKQNNTGKQNAAPKGAKGGGSGGHGGGGKHK